MENGWAVRAAIGLAVCGVCAIIGGTGNGETMSGLNIFGRIVGLGLGPYATFCWMMGGNAFETPMTDEELESLSKNAKPRSKRRRYTGPAYYDRGPGGNA